MTEMRNILVECPSCKQPGFLESWPYFASTVDTTAYDLLLSGQLFKYTCPICGTKVSMAYDCLFWDVERNVFLYYAPDRSAFDAQRETLDALIARLLPDEEEAHRCQRRIVNTTFEFCEKARVLADGYDDRVIELMKVAIKRGMLEESIIGARDILIYERTLPDGGVSFIVSGDVPGDTVGVPQGYTYLKEQWKDALDGLTDEYRFDAAWANAFLP